MALMHFCGTNANPSEYHFFDTIGGQARVRGTIQVLVTAAMSLRMRFFEKQGRSRRDGSVHVCLILGKAGRNHDRFFSEKLFVSGGSKHFNEVFLLKR